MRLFGSAIIALLITLGLQAQSQGPFAPGVGSPGTKAIHKDSSIVLGWADSVIVHRGYLDIAQPGLGLVSHGQASNAYYYADGQVISLGDSGMATYVLTQPLTDHSGPELAIFENSFSDDFLELAFVEVSKDGQQFYRFPTISLVDTVVQTGAFGSTDPTQIQNLAGKYRADYGQPFDLKDVPELDSVNYIRIIDAIGSIDPNYASRDSQGNIINDPYPSNFPSGGFDLDALAFLHPSGLSVESNQLAKIQAYPNPAANYIQVKKALKLELVHPSGQILQNAVGSRMDFNSVQSGFYILIAEFEGSQMKTFKIQVLP